MQKIILAASILFVFSILPMTVQAQSKLVEGDVILVISKPLSITASEVILATSGVASSPVDVPLAVFSTLTSTAYLEALFKADALWALDGRLLAEIYGAI